MSYVLVPKDRLAADYRTHVETRGLDPCTVRQYCIRLSCFLDYLDRNPALTLDSLNFNDVQDFIIFHSRNNGVHTRRTMHVVLRDFFFFACRRGIMKVNLAAAVPGIPVKTAVCRRLDCAGIALGQGVKKGTHCFRYACATRMLKARSSLKTVADALGHRKLDSVQFYNKLDVDALREIALPWPGGAL